MKALIQTPTHYSNDAGLKKAADLIAERLTPLDFQSRWIPEQHALLAERAPPQALLTVFLTAHFDSPHKNEVEAQGFQTKSMDGETLIYGISALDNKAGVLQLIRILELLNQSPLDHLIHWRILFQGDEEVFSFKSKSLLESIASPSDLALVLEPSWFDPASKTHFLPTSVGGNLQANLIFQRAPTHPAISKDLGRSASDDLLESLTELRKLRSKGISVHIPNIQSNSSSNISTQKAEARISFRYPKNEDREAIIRALDKEVTRTQQKGAAFLFSIRDIWLPHSLHSPSEIFEVLRSVMSELEMGALQPAQTLTHDAASFISHKKVPVFTSMGPRGGGIHEPEEYVIASSIEKMARVNCGLILKILRKKTETL